MSTNSLQPIWTPTDAAAIAEVAAQFPTEVGQSEMLSYLMDSEGLR